MCHVYVCLHFYFVEFRQLYHPNKEVSNKPSATEEADGKIIWLCLCASFHSFVYICIDRLLMCYILEEPMSQRMSLEGS